MSAANKIEGEFSSLLPAFKAETAMAPGTRSNSESREYHGAHDRRDP